MEVTTKKVQTVPRKTSSGASGKNNGLLVWGRNNLVEFFIREFVYSFR